MPVPCGSRSPIRFSRPQRRRSHRNRGGLPSLRELPAREIPHLEERTTLKETNSARSPRIGDAITHAAASDDNITPLTSPAEIEIIVALAWTATGGDKLNTVDWPESAASWLRPARRFAAPSQPSLSRCGNTPRMGANGSTAYPIDGMESCADDCFPMPCLPKIAGSRRTRRPFRSDGTVRPQQHLALPRRGIHVRRNDHMNTLFGDDVIERARRELAPGGRNKTFPRPSSTNAVILLTSPPPDWTLSP